jgi:VWFA-related protein
MRQAMAVPCIALCCCLADPAAQVVFRAGVDLVEVDAAVVNAEGRPALGLNAADFILRVDGRPRTIESVDYVNAVATSPNDSSVSAAETIRRTARHVLFIVDEGNISAGGGRGAIRAAGRVLAQLGPRDRIGVLTIPSGPAVDFTEAHEPIQAALNKIVGHASTASGTGDYSLNDQELFAFDIGGTNDDRILQQRVLARECPQTMPPERREVCESSLRSDAQDRLDSIRERTRDALGQLEKVFRALGGMAGAKSVIFVSEGLLMRPDHRDDRVIETLGAQAATAGVRFYAVLLDSPTVDASDAGARARPPSQLPQDRTIREDGLSALATTSGGVFVRITAAPDAAFQRLGTSLSGFYVVAFRVLPTDGEGPHQIKLASARTDLSVHARSQFVKPSATAHAAPARTPPANTTFSSLKIDKTTLRLATRSIPDTDGRIRLVLSVDVLDPAANPVSALALGYKLKAGDRILADTGRIVPVVRDVDGARPISYVAFQGLTPGQYKLDVSASDGTKHTAFVSHPLVASLHTIGAYRLSDLFLAASAPNDLGPFPTPAVPVISTGEAVMGVDVAAPDAAALAGAAVLFAIVTKEGTEAQAGPAQPLAVNGPLDQFVRATLQVPNGGHTEYIGRATLLVNGTSLGQIDAPFRVVYSGK